MSKKVFGHFAFPLREMIEEAGVQTILKVPDVHIAHFEEFYPYFSGNISKSTSLQIISEIHHICFHYKKNPSEFCLHLQTESYYGMILDGVISNQACGEDCSNNYQARRIWL